MIAYSFNLDPFLEENGKNNTFFYHGCDLPTMTGAPPPGRYIALLMYRLQQKGPGTIHAIFQDPFSYNFVRVFEGPLCKQLYSHRHHTFSVWLIQLLLSAKFKVYERHVVLPYHPSCSDLAPNKHIFLSVIMLCGWVLQNVSADPESTAGSDDSSQIFSLARLFPCHRFVETTLSIWTASLCQCMYSYGTGCTVGRSAIYDNLTKPSACPDAFAPQLLPLNMHHDRCANLSSTSVLDSMTKTCWSKIIISCCPPIDMQLGSNSLVTNLIHVWRSRKPLAIENFQQIASTARFLSFRSFWRMFFIHAMLFSFLRFKSLTPDLSCFTLYTRYSWESLAMLHIVLVHPRCIGFIFPGSLL